MNKVTGRSTPRIKRVNKLGGMGTLTCARYPVSEYDLRESLLPYERIAAVLTSVQFEPYIKATVQNRWILLNIQLSQRSVVGLMDKLAVMRDKLRCEILVRTHERFNTPPTPINTFFCA